MSDRYGNQTRVFHFRQFMKNKHEKVVFVSLTYSAVFTFLLNSLLSVSFQVSNLKLTLSSSLLYEEISISNQ